MSMQSLVFGTDGSCLRNPDGPTGWAYVCQDGRYSFGGCVAGTNQIGELMAILTVLRDFPDQPLEIQSDSAYAIGCSSTWKLGWQRAGYVRKTGPIANLDIIRPIHQLLDTRGAAVVFVKVKAHLVDETVHPLNVRADELAGRGARAARAARADVIESGTWLLSSGEPEPSDEPEPDHLGSDRLGSDRLGTKSVAPLRPAAVTPPIDVREPELETTGFLF